MVVFLQCALKEKLQFVIINTLLLHIPLFALTDRGKDRQRLNKSWLGWVTYSSSRLILVGLGNLQFSRLILVGLGNLRFLQVNPGWAG